MVTTMGVPSIATFEVEVVESDSKFERRQAMRRFEKIRRPSKGRSSKVAELPSLGPSNEGIVVVYLHKDKPNNFNMS